jgi:hypothetical protein
MNQALVDLCKYLDENIILVNLHQPADVIRQLHAENERMREHVRQLEIARPTARTDDSIRN